MTFEQTANLEITIFARGPSAPKIVDPASPPFAIRFPSPQFVFTFSSNAMSCKHYCYHFVGAACLFVSFTMSAAAGERFVAEHPANPDRNFFIVKIGRTLLVTDSDGGKLVYERQPSHDSYDGQMEAYYSSDAQQFVRWPNNNSGRMELGSPAGRSVLWKSSVTRIRRADSYDRPAVARQAPPQNVRIGVSATFFNGRSRFGRFSGSSMSVGAQVVPRRSR